MKKRILLFVMFALTVVMPANAVLKEDSLSQTLSILRQELTTYHDEYSERHKMAGVASERVFRTLMEAMNRSNQNALMLYSQRDGYVFDLTYACHEAIEQYHAFEMHIVPFRTFVEKSNVEVARYDSLISCLKAMPIQLLDEKSKMDRSVCLAVAVNTRRMLVESRDQLNEYIHWYQLTENRLKNLNDYANMRYKDIQNSIFVNGDDTYFSILSRFGSYLVQTKESVAGKYRFGKKITSQWDARFILGLFVVILVYGFIAILINQIIVRWLVTRMVRKGMMDSIADFFLAKRTCIIMTSTVVTFAILLGIVQLIAEQNFIVMASGLLVEYAWLLSAILVSLLIRLSSEQIMKTFRIYAPLLLNGFVVISFRIVLIPNDLVNLLFPAILLLCCLWQWYVIGKHSKHVDKSDVVYAYVSQCVFVVSLVSSLCGYTLLSVQILIWWIMQLTGILTITCIRDWYKEYARIKKLDNKPVTQTWMQTFFYLVVLPSAAVFSVMLSLYTAADVFNLSDLTFELFSHPFVESPNFTASFFSVTLVAVLFFLFNYINTTLKAVTLLYFERQDPSTAVSRHVMVKNVLQVVVWGVWFLVSMAIFNVSNSWLVVISGGLSTGVGFASKDILENIYYGISLMAGRIKIGDLIVCDGVRGTVSSISYTSTMITAADGSVIAFQNSQLFTKNYKNMTRNHGYELHILDVGIAYGSNVKEVKRMLHDAIIQLDCIEKSKGVNIVLKELGDSALVLKIAVWVNVYTQFADDGVILECVYNTLNDNNVEIPFPQQDVYIKKVADK